MASSFHSPVLFKDSKYEMTSVVAVEVVLISVCAELVSDDDSTLTKSSSSGEWNDMEHDIETRSPASCD